MKVKKIYSMIYDGGNVYGEYLGEFKIIKWLKGKSPYDLSEKFIGVNTETEEVCFVTSGRQLFAKGIFYKIIPIPELMLKQ